jgi:hypothetical protein
MVCNLSTPDLLKVRVELDRITFGGKCECLKKIGFILSYF